MVLARESILCLGYFCFYFIIFEVQICFVRPLNYTAVLYSMFEYD